MKQSDVTCRFNATSSAAGPTGGRSGSSCAAAHPSQEQGRPVGWRMLTGCVHRAGARR